MHAHCASCRWARGAWISDPVRRLLAALVGNYRCCGWRSAAAVAAAKGLCILPDHAIDTEPSGSFDAVVMVDVFEHLLAPLFGRLLVH